MAFDDLARHMAARDRNKKAMISGDGNAIIAEATKVTARRNRQLDLVFGPLLILGGIAGLALLIFEIEASSDYNHRRSAGLMAVAAACVIVGLRKLTRGVRNNSSDYEREPQDFADVLPRRR